MKFSPKLTVMSKYLTPHILSAECTEMAQVNRDITVGPLNMEKFYIMNCV